MPYNELGKYFVDDEDHEWRDDDFYTDDDYDDYEWYDDAIDYDWVYLTPVQKFKRGLRNWQARLLHRIKWIVSKHYRDHYDDIPF